MVENGGGWGLGARSWPFVAILGADRRSSPLPPPWPLSLNSAGAGPSRPPPGPPGSGCRPCIAGLRWAAGATLGSPPWWGPWRSPRPPGKPFRWWKNPDPPSGGSENWLSVGNGKETEKRDSIVSKPRAPPAVRFENQLSLRTGNRAGKQGGRFSRNRGLFPPAVSRIGFPCKQWIEQRKLLPKYSRNRGSSRPDRFENWLYLKAGKKAGNERGRSSRNRGGAVMVQSGLPPLGVQGSEPRVKPSRGERGGRVPGRSLMPKPFRGQISGSSPTGMLIRASKDAWCRGLYRRLGPEEFYRRRLAWLQAHGKTTSYNRLVAYLAKRGIEISDMP